jgi:hypothetical protein
MDIYDQNTAFQWQRDSNPSNSLLVGRFPGYNSTWTDWRFTTTDGGNTWSAIFQTTTNTTGTNNWTLSGNPTSTSCVGGLKENSATLAGGFDNSLYLYMPDNPGSTWTGVTFGDPPCPTGYTGSGQPNCTVTTSGGSGAGITESDVFTALQTYFTPRVKEVIGLFIAMFAGVLIIQQFRWRFK